MKKEKIAKDRKAAAQKAEKETEKERKDNEKAQRKAEAEQEGTCKKTLGQKKKQAQALLTKMSTTLSALTSSD